MQIAVILHDVESHLFYSAALRCALSRCSSLMSLPVRMITFHPREYLVRRCSNPRRLMQRATFLAERGRFTALREGIDNRPPKCAYHLLHVLVDQLLDPIREAWGEPIVVSSGYRCKELNALVGGVKNSHHLLGCAADIIAGSKADHRKLFKMIQQMQQQGQIRFTQLIWEGDGRWIHISYVPSDLRCQVIGEN